MALFNSQQSPNERPDFRPGHFEVPKPGTPDLQRGREGTFRPTEQTWDGEPNAEELKRRISEQIETTEASGVTPGSEGNPGAKQMLEDIYNGKKNIEELQINNASDAEAINQALIQ